MTENQNTELRARIIAAAITLIVMIAVAILLRNSYMSFSEMAVASNNNSDVVLDEEFVDILEMPAAPDMVGDEPAKATADEMLESQPTPISGTDLTDNGDAGKPHDVVAKKEEAPMKVNNKKDDKKVGATDDKKKRQEEEIKRQANNEVANAFNKASGKHNNATSNIDVGNNGRPDGTAPQGTLTGTGTGTVGGGWSIPSYGAVKSTVTGSVKMILKINKEGRVVSVTFDGGTAPAATNAAVRQACKAEVMARRFTRANYNDAPETTNAYITYTFK